MSESTEEELQYPTVEELITYNKLVLELVHVKRADRPEVLSSTKIVEAIQQCRELSGDVYTKAAFLLRVLVQSHPFASGNRRTAFLVVKQFVQANGKNFSIADDPVQARVFQGIRENFYTPEEIMTWIKHGKIKPFKR